MTTTSYRKRLERLEAGILRRTPEKLPSFTVVNASGSGAPSSVIGPDGRDVWWNPPEGHKVGELLEDSAYKGPGGPSIGFRIVFGYPTDRKWGPFPHNGNGSRRQTGLGGAASGVKGGRSYRGPSYEIAA
jgi:hypothetical protein